MNKHVKGCLFFTLFVIVTFVGAFYAMIHIMANRKDEGVKVDYHEYSRMKEAEFYSSSFKGVYRYNRSLVQMLEIGFITNGKIKRSAVCRLSFNVADTGRYEGMENDNLFMAKKWLLSTETVESYINPHRYLDDYNQGDSLFKEPNKHYLTLNGEKFFLSIGEK